MTFTRLSTVLALSTLAFGCAPLPAEGGNRASDVTSNDPDPTAPIAADHDGVRPIGSLVWNMSLEGKGSGMGTTPVLDALLLRTDGSMAAWISTAVDGTDQFDTQLFHGTYAFSKRAKDATDSAPFAYPVDDRYEDVANGAKDDADAYLIVLTLSTGDTQTYAYYLETDGTWHLRNVATNVWMGLNPPTDNGANVTYCETAADCATGVCTAPPADAIPLRASRCM